MIYTFDHEPAHVHVTGPGQAKVNLVGPNGDIEVVSEIGIKKSDMRRLKAEITERRDYFLREWERIHGDSD